MKNVLIICSIITIIFGCKKEISNDNKYNIKSIGIANPEKIKDTIPRVTGIGGIFFSSNNSQATLDWYRKNLGLVIDDYGSVFEFRNANYPEQINYLRWSVFNKDDEYFKPSNKVFMINYRVNNLEGLVRKLRNNGVKIVDTISTYSFGKFVHIVDDDGTKLELWEPIDIFLTKLGGKTNK